LNFNYCAMNMKKKSEPNTPLIVLPTAALHYRNRGNMQERRGPVRINAILVKQGNLTTY
jgi:hypothetical protein